MNDPVAAARDRIALILEIAAAELTDEADFRDDLEADSLQIAEISAVLEDDFGLEPDPDAPPARFSEVRDRLGTEDRP